MKKSTQVIIGIIVLLVGFGGGWLYGKSTAAAGAASSRGSYTGSFGGSFGGTGAGRSGSGTFAGRGGTAGGSAVAGTIADLGDGTLSIALPNSTSTSATTGSIVILYSPSTNILKTVLGSAADLSVGENVVVTGTTNSDGSMTASEIQVRNTNP